MGKDHLLEEDRVHLPEALRPLPGPVVQLRQEDDASQAEPVKGQGQAGLQRGRNEEGNRDATTDKFDPATSASSSTETTVAQDLQNGREVNSCVASARGSRRRGCTPSLFLDGTN